MSSEEKNLNQTELDALNKYFGEVEKDINKDMSKERKTDKEPVEKAKGVPTSESYHGSDNERTEISQSDHLETDFAKIQMGLLDTDPNSAKAAELRQRRFDIINNNPEIKNSLTEAKENIENILEDEEVENSDQFFRKVLDEARDADNKIQQYLYIQAADRLLLLKMEAEGKTEDEIKNTTDYKNYKANAFWDTGVDKKSAAHLLGGERNNAGVDDEEQEVKWEDQILSPKGESWHDDKVIVEVQGGGGISAQAEGYLAQQLDEAKKQTELKEKERQEGKHAFLENLYYQGEAFYDDLKKEAWYPGLKENERLMIAASNRILRGLDAKKGGTDERPKKPEDFIMSLSLKRYEMEAFGRSEGFRISFASVLNDFFELEELDTGYDRNSGAQIVKLKGGKNSLDDNSQTPQDKKVKLKVRGQEVYKSAKEILKDDSEGYYQAYREQMVNKIAHHLRQNPDLIGFGLTNDKYQDTDDTDPAKLAAQAYFGMSWNLMSYCLAVESGDVYRESGVRDTTAFVGSFRRLMHPHAEAYSKFIKQEGETLGTDDIAFGNLGIWAGSTCRLDRKFRDGLKDYKEGYRYFLKTTVGSAFDHAIYRGGKTVGQVLLSAETRKLDPDDENSLLTFSDYEGDVNFSNLENEDILFFYKIKLDSVKKMHDVLYAKEGVRDNELSGKFTEYLKELISAEGLSQTNPEDRDPVLSAIYDPANEQETIKDQVVAAIGGLSGGFREYTPNAELILDFDFIQYDGLVNNLMNDTRLATALGVSIGSRQFKKLRKELRQRLNARDVDSWFDNTHNRRYSLQAAANRRAKN